MSYTNRNSGQTRGTAWMAVAALHGAALYALINGLGTEYMKETIANLPSRNYEMPSPLPEVTPEPAPEKQTGRTVDVTEPKIPGIPTRGPIIMSPPPIEDFKPIELPKLPIPMPLPPAPEFKTVAAAPRTSPGSWVTANDYPTRDLRQGNAGTAEFTLTIGADGRVTDCRITRSTGHPGLDQATCSKVSQRARFTPARNESNQSVTGTFSSRIAWVIPE